LKSSRGWRHLLAELTEQNLSVVLSREAAFDE
jgi:hypothetical protein